ncbi:MAG: Hsp20/alpha crystallin family protein [Minicystis sp.]
MANMTRKGEQQREQSLARGWDPLRAVVDPFRMIREMMSGDVFGGPAAGPDVFAPDIEVKETKDAFVVRADLPGVQERDIDIDITGNRLTLTGKREEEHRDEGDRFFAYERTYGTFTRSLTLPEGVDMDQVKAELKNGVLEIDIPKRAEAHARKVPLGGSSGEARGSQIAAGPGGKSGADLRAEGGKTGADLRAEGGEKKGGEKKAA